MFLSMAASMGYRMRADKKAMRNSLVRFGKRSGDESMSGYSPNAFFDDTLQYGQYVPKLRAYRVVAVPVDNY
jgi:hypothetical protein